MKKTINLLILIILLIMTGCDRKKDMDDPYAANLAAAIDAYIQNEISAGESLPLMQRVQNDILKEITYTIQEFNVTEGTMTVEFTYVDVLELADSITDTNITEEEYYRYCIERLSSGQQKMITESIQVSFEPSEMGYSIIGSEPLTNVLTGGVLYYYMELLEGIGYE